MNILGFMWELYSFQSIIHGFVIWFHGSSKLIIHCLSIYCHAVPSINTPPLRHTHTRITCTPYTYRHICALSSVVYIHADRNQWHCYTQHFLYTDHMRCYNCCRSSVTDKLFGNINGVCIRYPIFPWLKKCFFISCHLSHVLTLTSDTSPMLFTSKRTVTSHIVTHIISSTVTTRGVTVIAVVMWGTDYEQWSRIN